MVRPPEKATCGRRGRGSARAHPDALAPDWTTRCFGDDERGRGILGHEPLHEKAVTGKRQRTSGRRRGVVGLRGKA